MQAFTAVARYQHEAHKPPPPTGIGTRLTIHTGLQPTSRTECADCVNSPVCLANRGAYHAWHSTHGITQRVMADEGHDDDDCGCGVT